MNPRRQRRRVALITGFTLVEVLLAIVILSLGLLGLGAVIPVVIRQQRLAGDLISGVSAAASAEAAIRGRFDLRTPHEAEVSGDPLFIEPWRAWRDDIGRGGLSFDFDQSQPESRRAGYWRVPAYDASTGALAIRGDDNPDPDFNFEGDVEDRFTFSVSQRLLPAPTPGGPAPRYVWDFVARRVVARDAEGFPRFEFEFDPENPDPPETGSDRVQIAVFVRAIDPAIRTPRGVTLAEAFTGIGENGNDALGDEDRRVPVSVSLGADTGGPQFNGNVGTGDRAGAFATPIVLLPGELDRGVGNEAEYEDPIRPTADRTDDRSRLTFRAGQAASDGAQLPSDVPAYEGPGSPDPVATGDVAMSARQAIALAGQLDQQLVDAYGNVYRVIGRDGDQLIIDPPVPSWVQRPEDLIAIAFVPQVPASVRVFTLELD